VIRISRVHCQDFCLFEQAEFSLDKRGLVWIRGVNEDSDAAASNGSGKSTIFKAIAWGLYGKCLDSKGGDEIIRHGSKSAKVEVDIIDAAGKTYRVKRERKGGSPKLKLVMLAGEVEESVPGARGDLQEVVDGLVGLDFDSFRNTVFFGQRDFKRFIGAGDTDRKTLLHSILGSMVYRACLSIVKEESAKLGKSITALQSAVDKLHAQMGEYDVEGLEVKSTRWAEEKAARVGRLKSKAKAALEEARECESAGALAEEMEEKATKMRLALPDAVHIEEDIEALSLEIAKATREDADASALHREHKSRHNEHKSRYELFEHDQCPECGSDLATGGALKTRKRLESDIAKTEASTRASAGALARAHGKLAELNSRMEELKASRAVARSGAIKCNMLEESAKEQIRKSKNMDVHIKASKDLLEEAKLAASEANPFKDQIENARVKLEAYAAEVGKGEVELQQQRHERAHYEFWVKGFSDHGLPSFVLDAAMPYLTDKANEYLEVLSDGDIHMEFRTQRELKSSKGELRDEIEVLWEIEGKPNYPPSGGQMKKMEIATDLALMDLASARDSSHVDLLLMDEVLDGLDSEGAQRVVRLLHNLRKQRGTILVISHQSDLADAFEKCWSVTKTDGVSQLDAAA
jgi:DNA repair exonuclease SbcCD ATPase subunit